MTIQSTQPRVLFFDFDGEGLGHLRRLSHIAGAIQGPCSTLFLTGHRAAAWIVPETSEFVHIPSLESFLPEQTQFWNRAPFLDSIQQGFALRGKLIEATVTAFRPDAIFMDYLPKGLNCEMEGVIRDFPARKYFILRGVLGEPESSRATLLDQGCQQLLETVYDRIFVATDRRIIDVAQEYRLNDTIADKLEYSGYVMNPISAELREQAREQRGIKPGQKWVVCSAGGGMSGESLIESSQKLACEMPDVAFDIITGPKSKRPVSDYHRTQSNVFFRSESHDLPLLHGACDVLICHGGYNSLVEGMTGGGHIIVMIPPHDVNFERLTHATRLSNFYPVHTSDAAQLSPCVQNVLSNLGSGIRHQCETPLRCDGIQEIRRVLFKDLGLEWRRQVGELNGIRL